MTQTAIELINDIELGIKRVRAWLPNLLGTDEQYNDLTFALKQLATLQAYLRESHSDTTIKLRFIITMRDLLCDHACFDRDCSSERKARLVVRAFANLYSKHNQGPTCKTYEEHEWRVEDELLKEIGL